MPYKSPLLTAKCLDSRRLNKQIIECKQILKAISGESAAWMNHPICRMYKNHTDFIVAYLNVLSMFRSGNYDEDEIIILDKKAKDLLPDFITEDYYSTMKRRLYTKDKAFYKQFKDLGECEYNLYYVDNKWVKYINGKIQK